MTTRSAPAAAAAGSSVVSSASSSRRTAANVSARRAQATIEVPGLSRRSTRASDEPISPIPISATRSNELFAHRAAMNLGRASLPPLHLLAGADRDPQTLRQTVGAHLAGQDAARLQKGEGRVGVLARIVGKAGEHEIGRRSA